MARNIVNSWAERLWQINPPRNYMSARWQQVGYDINEQQQKAVLKRNIYAEF